MNIEQLNDDARIYKIMNKPLPHNFGELGYLKKLKYVPLIYLKRRILTKRADTTLEQSRNELCINTPGLHIEHLRCTELEKMEQYLSERAEPIIEIQLNCVVPVIGVRVGDSMSNLLKSRGALIKIVDIYDEEILISDIQTTFIKNKQFLG